MVIVEGENIFQPLLIQWLSSTMGLCDADDKAARELSAKSLRTFFGPDRPYLKDQTHLYEQLVDSWGGVPDHLTFKISDTGRGISQERLEKVFVGGQRDKNPLLGESHGIGLSSAIRLLDEIGGRLEVMSKPDVGTTIWAHVPMVPPRRDGGPLRTASANEVLKRVVTIRNVANG